MKGDGAGEIEKVLRAQRERNEEIARLRRDAGGFKTVAPGKGAFFDWDGRACPECGRGALQMHPRGFECLECGHVVTPGDGHPPPGRAVPVRGAKGIEQVAELYRRGIEEAQKVPASHWLTELARVAIESPDPEVREAAAERLINPPVFYTEGLVEEAALEQLGMSAIPVIGEPAKVISIGGDPAS